MKDLAKDTAKLMHKTLYRRGIFTFGLVKDWRQLVPGFAPFCYPLHVRGDVLTLAVNSDSAAVGIKMQAPAIISRINQYLGGTYIRKIQCIHKSFPVRLATPHTVIEPDEAALRQAENLCAHLRDDDMKKALVNMSGAYFARKKALASQGEK